LWDAIGSHEAITDHLKITAVGKVPVLAGPYSCGSLVWGIFNKVMLLESGTWTSALTSIETVIEIQKTSQKRQFLCAATAADSVTTTSKSSPTMVVRFVALIGNAGTPLWLWAPREYLDMAFQILITTSHSIS
jgi:hypothetical protein